MLTKVNIPLANPIRLVPYNEDPSAFNVIGSIIQQNYGDPRINLGTFDNNFFDSSLPSFIETPKVYQKFQTNGILSLQVHATNKLYTQFTYAIAQVCEFVDGKFVTKQWIDPQYVVSVSGLLIDGTATNTMHWNIPMYDYPALNNLDGIYYVKVYVYFADSTSSVVYSTMRYPNYTMAYISEPIDIRAKHPDTQLIQYSSPTNYLKKDSKLVFVDTNYPIFSFFVESYARYNSTASQDSTYRDSEWQLKQTSSFPYRVYDYYVGTRQGAPQWLIDKISRALTFANIDGAYFSIDNFKYIKKESSNWNNAIWQPSAVMYSKVQLVLDQEEAVNTFDAAPVSNTNYFTISVHITSPSETFGNIEGDTSLTIDWGDSSNLSSGTSLSHVFADAGDYIVKVYYDDSITHLDFTTSNMAALSSLGGNCPVGLIEFFLEHASHVDQFDLSWLAPCASVIDSITINNTVIRSVINTFNIYFNSVTTVDFSGNHLTKDAVDRLYNMLYYTMQNGGLQFTGTINTSGQTPKASPTITSLAIRTEIVTTPYSWNIIADGYLLDIYPGASVAYSLRKLVDTATNAVRIRATDNTEQDFGFLTNGDFDATAFSTFIGAHGGNGYVKTWYDQSNGNDATQTTHALQPELILSISGSIAGIKFTGSSSQLLPMTSTVTLTAGIANFNIVKKISTGNVIEMLGMVSPPVGKASFSEWDASGLPTFTMRDTNPAAGYSVFAASPVNDTNLHLIGALGDTHTGSLVGKTIYIDSAVSTSDTSSSQPLSTYDNIGFGDATYCTGYISEIILYAFATMDGNYPEIVNSIKTYYGL